MSPTRTPARTLAAALACIAGAAGCADLDGGVEEHAAPVIGSPSPSPTAGDEANLLISPQAPLICPPPGPQTCLDDNWVRFCAARYGATDPTAANLCKTINENPNNPLTTYLGGKTLSDRAFDERTQEFVPALPPSTIPHVDAQTPAKNSWAAQENVAQFQALAALLPYGPAAYVRPIGATNVGATIDSCENYVYRSFYDVERWLDAINAAKGDAKKMVDVSFTGVSGTGEASRPGIVRRAIRDADGNELADRLGDLAHWGLVYVSDTDPFSKNYRITGDLPKNAFYAASQYLITKSVIDAFAPRGQNDEVQALLNELYRGQTLYQLDGIASGGTPIWGDDGKARRGFYDEWDFHDYMRKKNAALTPGEYREFRRRGEAINASWNALADYFKCKTADMLTNGCRAVPNAIGKVFPGDTMIWEGDPLAYRKLLGSVDPAAFLTPPALSGRIGFGSRLALSAISADQLLTVGVSSGLELIGSGNHLPGLYVEPAPALAASKPALTATSLVVVPTPNVTGLAPYRDPVLDTNIVNARGLIDFMWQANPPRIDTSKPYPYLDCNGVPAGREISGGAFELVSDPQLHTEGIWKAVCDATNLVLLEWGRKLEGHPSCIDPTKEHCDWQPQDFVDRFVVKNVSYAAAAKEAEYRECKRWTGGGKLTDTTNTSKTSGIGIPAAERTSLAKVRAYFNARKATFEALLANVPIKASDDFGTTRLDKETIGNDLFGGGYDYSLGWHLKVYRGGQDQICRGGGNAIATFNAGCTLFGVDISVVDTLASVSSNDGDGGRTFGNAHLTVLGYEVFNTADEDGALASGDLDLTLFGSYSDTESDGESPTLFKVPFQIGPVTLTITGGIYYVFGVTTTFEATAPGARSCAAKPAYNARALFTPFAGFGVWADADVSLAGLIGVGVEVTLELVGIQLPLDAHVWMDELNDDPRVNFAAKLDLVLSTLKGSLSAYIETFWIKAVSITIVEWDGFRHSFPIFRTPRTTVSLGQLTKGSIKPPAGGSAAEVDK